MKLGIMQPYFFPYLGYFSLIKNTDKFIFFDTPQYISHGWVNRNRILKQDGTDTYITVPIVKAPRETAINRICINENEPWREKIYGQLAVYKRKAPNYRNTMEIIHGILDSDCYGDNLSKLNIISTIEVCKYIGIDKSFDIFSEMNLSLGEINAPDEWALEITLAMGYDTYVNPPGGKSFFDKQKYAEKSLSLEFLSINSKPYIQRVGYFVPGLSVIDALMFCDKKEICDMLNDFNIEY